MLLLVGSIIFLVLGTSTVLQIRTMQRDYLQMMMSRADALGQYVLTDLFEKLEFGAQNLQAMTGYLTLRCLKLYALNKDKQVSHVAVLDPDGKILAHNEQALWETRLTSPEVLNALRTHEPRIVLNGETYHVLVPIIWGTEQVCLGSLDFGVPKSIVDQNIQQALQQSVLVFVIFLFIAFLALSLLMQVLLTKPVQKLVHAGRQLAEGDLQPIPQRRDRRDEIGTVVLMFNHVVEYLQNLTVIASQVATGRLDGDMTIRSARDQLGQAVHDMLLYLQHVADIASKISDGDLTDTVHIRSQQDAFGKVMSVMTEGLRRLIVQIRGSAEQIAATGQHIASLSSRDIDIVEQIHHSAEVMTATMQELRASVEEVAHNMDTLSASVDVTSASMVEMTSSITHIAMSANTLTNQSHQTIDSLHDTLRSLESVLVRTEKSAQLSRGTIQDALNGQEAVEQVMQSMETIQDTVKTSVEAITSFEARSRDITTILEVIREITEQTSLLALNASIIAAQAGVHGRGFAVVAEEIKNLATGVTNSTKDIGAIVETLQHDTGRVVQTIYKGAEGVKQGMERTYQAQEMLKKILESARQSSSEVMEIAVTLQQVRQSSQTVSRAMEEVNLMTDGITTATNQQDASTQQINDAIGRIKDMASQIHRATTEQLTSTAFRKYLHTVRPELVEGQHEHFDKLSANGSASGCMYTYFRNAVLAYARWRK